MYDHIFDAFDRFKRAVDQVLSALCQHLDGNIIRYHVFLYKFAQEIIFDLGRRRETYLNLLKSQF